MTEHSQRRWSRIHARRRPVYGLVDGDEVVEVNGSPFTRYSVSDRRHLASSVTFLVPAAARNFYAMGLNYVHHIEWSSNRNHKPVEIPQVADIGYRSPNALIATGEDIVIPADSEGPVEAEGELVAVIGRKAKSLSEAEALSCVLGYTLGNDLSERSWQQTDRTLWRAKNTDTFKPIGPVIVSGLDPLALTISIRVNGRVTSQYATAGMIFTPSQVIARMTKYITLYPGDVIWFGTDGSTEPALRSGDYVEIECPEIGVLKNRIVKNTD